ncbi:condensation protein [Streptomyces mashuensis]|uniref:diacylglycerol O-acyltransferase n=1 Tax=Streptomyces mashuensis TaxID=33904 RepID=A0A919B7I1_9ACTN|nr:WS/DGAT domain-containing protein [Streptomyces mashuensis]GHF59346.1 condensation protein [Streptomyces mashuensis]
MAGAPGVSVPFDNGFLAYGAAHPGTQMAIGVAALCAGDVPSRAELGLLLEAAASACPELAGPGGGAVFRPGRHLFESRAPEGSGTAGLYAALDAVANEPLPGVMWGVWLVHGHAPGEFAVVLRGHHAHFDGLLIAQLCELVVGARPAAVRPAPTAPPRPRPGAVVRDVAAVLRGLRDTARPVAAAGTTEGRVRQVCAATGLEGMRRVAAVHGGTVNDVHLAALAGALAAWETGPRWHGDPRPVRAKVPLGLRRPGTAERLGTRISAGWLTLPCDTADPVERLRRVAADSGRLRARLTDPGTGALMRALSPRMRRLVLDADNHPRRTSLVATHVPGPARPLSVAGRDVTGIVPLMFLASGQRLSVCLATYAGTAYFSVTADTGVTGLDRLPGCWLAEIGRLATVSGRPGRTPRQG